MVGDANASESTISTRDSTSEVAAEDGDDAMDKAATDCTCSFAFNIEQKQGEGEDADPLLLVDEIQVAGTLGVFDGMGGAGATQYQHEGRRLTGAYIASRLARLVADRYFADTTKIAPLVNERAAQLRERLSAMFRRAVGDLDKSSGPRLGGTMTRRLPTTMTCLTYGIESSGLIGFDVFWAGDSRAYLLTTKSGLQQLSTDDLRSGADALQNLTDDSPVSNCIDADSDYVVNAVSGTCEPPLVLVAATDGCFNYFQSPAHFEHALLSAMQESSDGQSWSLALQRRLGEVAGDDLSMALVAIGWPSFKWMQAKFAERLRHVAEHFVEPLTEIDARVSQIGEAHRTEVQRRDEMLRSLWNEYKQSYDAVRLGAREG